MATKLIELDNRTIMDTGQVVAKYPLLLERIRSGREILDLPMFYHPDAERYGRRHGQVIEFVKETEEMEGPTSETFDWNIPEEYKQIDVVQLIIDMLEQKGLTEDEYLRFLYREITLIEERQMMGFIRCLIYITDTFRQNGVVWGVGRGSSCASLVLFLLDINKVDPVRYGIPLEEFYK